MADQVPLGMEFMRWQSVPSLTGDKGGRAVLGMLLNSLGSGGGGGGVSDAMSAFRQMEIGQQGQFDPSAPPAMPVAPAVPTGFELQAVPPPGGEPSGGAPMMPNLGQPLSIPGLSSPGAPSAPGAMGAPNMQQLPNLMDLVKKHFGFGG